MPALKSHFSQNNFIKNICSVGLSFESLGKINP